jgi:hypothetical protein
MNLAQALKKKNRLAGELVRQQQILQRENSRRNDNVSGVDRAEVWDKIIDLSDKLAELKGKITQANINIYPALESMAELKARISFLQGLLKREGEEVQLIGRDQEKMVYTWDSYINQEDCDEKVAALQEQINEFQDEVDAYNTTTQIVD